MAFSSVKQPDVGQVLLLGTDSIFFGDSFIFSWHWWIIYSFRLKKQALITSLYIHYIFQGYNLSRSSLQPGTIGNITCTWRKLLRELKWPIQNQLEFESRYSGPKPCYLHYNAAFFFFFNWRETNVKFPASLFYTYRIFLIRLKSIHSFIHLVESLTGTRLCGCVPGYNTSPYSQESNSFERYKYKVAMCCVQWNKT